MRFLCDNDVAEAIGVSLRRDGYDVEFVRKALTAEVNDEVIWPYAIHERRIMITCNRDDFLVLANASMARGETFPGLSIIRHHREAWRGVPKLRELIARAGESGLANNINFA